MHSNIEDLIEDIRQGRMIVLADDEDRENEGDLVMAAEKIRPQDIAFMACYGRGLICVALEGDRLDQLQIPLQPARYQSTFETAFCLSVEARYGVSTGISAADRARTARLLADPSATMEDFSIPGHIFPLRAHSAGVLGRTGHTESAVDLARLGGLFPAGVICEIMNEDGTMARRADLEAFSLHHGLKMGTVASLVRWRRAHS